MQGRTRAYLQHGLQDHGVALHDLAQRDELRVGAQEVQRSPASRTRSRCRLRRTHLLLSGCTYCSKSLRCLAMHGGVITLMGLLCKVLVRMQQARLT